MSLTRNRGSVKQKHLPSAGVVGSSHGHYRNRELYAQFLDDVEPVINAKLLKFIRESSV